MTPIKISTLVILKGYFGACGPTWINIKKGGLTRTCVYVSDATLLMLCALSGRHTRCRTWNGGLVGIVEWIMVMLCSELPFWLWGWRRFRQQCSCNVQRLNLQCLSHTACCSTLNRSRVLQAPLKWNQYCCVTDCTLLIIYDNRSTDWHSSNIHPFRQMQGWWQSIWHLGWTVVSNSGQLLTTFCQMQIVYKKDCFCCKCHSRLTVTRWPLSRQQAVWSFATFPVSCKV